MNALGGPTTWSLKTLEQRQDRVFELALQKIHILPGNFSIFGASFKAALVAHINLQIYIINIDAFTMQPSLPCIYSLQFCPCLTTGTPSDSMEQLSNSRGSRPVNASHGSLEIRTVKWQMEAF